MNIMMYRREKYLFHFLSSVSVIHQPREPVERVALKGIVERVSLPYSQCPVGGCPEPSLPCSDQLRTVGDEVNCILKKRMVSIYIYIY